MIPLIPQIPLAPLILLTPLIPLAPPMKQLQLNLNVYGTKVTPSCLQTLSVSSHTVTIPHLNQTPMVSITTLHGMENLFSSMIVLPITA